MPGLWTVVFKIRGHGWVGRSDSIDPGFFIFGTSTFYT